MRFLQATERSDSSEITLPRVIRDLLIFAPSWNHVSLRVKTWEKWKIILCIIISLYPCTVLSIKSWNARKRWKIMYTVISSCYDKYKELKYEKMKSHYMLLYCFAVTSIKWQVGNCKLDSHRICRIIQSTTLHFKTILWHTLLAMPSFFSHLYFTFWEISLPLLVIKS